MTKLKRLNVISTYCNSADENHGQTENQELQAGEMQVGLSNSTEFHHTKEQVANKKEKNQCLDVQENEYEKLRQLTMQENQKILKEMGIKNIAKSMTSQKPKKKVAKQKTPVYISPLSSNRVANLRKIHRVIASNPPPPPPEKVPLTLNARYDVSQIVKGNQGGTKRRLSLVDENNEEDDAIFQVDDIASNPPPPPPEKVPSALNAGYAMSEIVKGDKRGTKRRLTLIDENDDDDDIFQVDDLASNAPPPPPQKVQLTSNTGYAMSKRVKGNKEGTKRRLTLVDENDDDDDEIFQDEEFADINRSIHTNQRDKQMVDCASVQEQLEGIENEKATEMENEPATDDNAIEMENESVLGALNKGRGYTHKVDIWKMKKTERICVTFDKFGHPVGEEGRELGQYLGTLVRMAENVSIEYSDWRKVPMQNKEDMYSLVKSKFTFHPVESSQIKKWIFFSMGKKWRTWKGLLKSRGYDPSLTIDEIVAQQTNNDKRVNPIQFKELVARWFTPEFQNTCVKKRSSRSKMKEPHVTGTKSFARLAHELAMDNDGMYPTRGEMYIKTRTRKDGSIVDDEALGVVTSLKAIASKSTSTSGVQVDFANDEYSKVKGPEKRGYVRLVGKMPATKSNGDSQIIQQLESATQTISQLQGAFSVMMNIIQEHIPNANLSAILSHMNLQVPNVSSGNELSSRSTEDGERADK